MKLIVFLGNPGKKYEKNRHNVGWLFADYLQKKWFFDSFREEKKFFGDISMGKRKGEKIYLLKPTTFMNLSGKSVLSVLQFYKMPIKNTLVIYDDKDQMFKNIRFREKGSAGGHNGVKDIIRVLGTDEISRVKIGVDSLKRTECQISTADFVLADFSEIEYTLLFRDIFPKVEQKTLDWLQ